MPGTARLALAATAVALLAFTAQHTQHHTSRPTAAGAWTTVSAGPAMRANAPAPDCANCIL